MALKSLCRGIASVAVVIGCSGSESTAPVPEALRFSYDVTGYSKSTTYSGVRAGFTIVGDPCVGGRSMLRIDMTSPEGVRTTFALRLDETHVPKAGTYPFSVARLPGSADVFYSDVTPISGWRGERAFLRLTGELRLIEVAESRVSGAFDFEAVSSWYGTQSVDVEGTFDATTDPDPQPTAQVCELSATPVWADRIETATLATIVGPGDPAVEVDVLDGSAIIGIKAVGILGCHAGAPTEIVLEGRTATITPRNYAVRPETVCPRAASSRVATAVVPFGSGPAIIRVKGLYGDPWPGNMMVIERSVTIP